MIKALKFTMRVSLIIISFLSVLFTQAQMGNQNDLDNELINVFLSKVNPYSFLDKNITGKNRISLFIGKLKHHKRFYQNADSVCNSSQDTLKLKFFCPLADSFKDVANLIPEKDLYEMKFYYQRETKPKLLDVDYFIENNMVRKHSDKYYQEINHNNYHGGILNSKEFPSIQIENVYYTNNKEVAIIVYNISSSQTNSSIGFYLFKNIRNIWWKAIGPIKL